MNTYAYYMCTAMLNGVHTQTDVQMYASLYTHTQVHTHTDTLAVT